MNLDKRLQALESRTDQGERVERIRVAGIRPDGTSGRHVSWVMTADGRFTSMQEPSL